MHPTKAPAVRRGVFRRVNMARESVCRKTDTQPRSQSGDQDAAKGSGLCSTCLHLEMCERPKPEGGVWHCERYEENSRGSRGAATQTKVEDEEADESGTTGEHA